MTLLLQGDALRVLRLLPDESVNTAASSPPYWGQRDYGVTGQIGRERAIDEYLQRLLAVYDEVKRVLRSDGTCWVNLGDKYQNNCAQLIPERFAIGMQERGWILRSKVIWHKKTCMPESVKSRFTNDWEPIYFFAKSKRHFFCRQLEPYSPNTMTRCDRLVQRNETFDPSRHKEDSRNPSQAPFRVLQRIAKTLQVPGQTPNGMHVARVNGIRQDIFDVAGRNMRCVWALPTAQYRQAHFAVWPPQLVERILRAGCPKGGTVLDPFVGSGTTLAVAEDLGCFGIGIDLNGDYLKLAEERVLAARVNRVRKMIKSKSANLADLDSDQDKGRGVGS